MYVNAKVLTLAQAVSKRYKVLFVIPATVGISLKAGVRL